MSTTSLSFLGLVKLESRFTHGNKDVEAFGLR